MLQDKANLLIKSKLATVKSITLYGSPLTFIHHFSSLDKTKLSKKISTMLFQNYSLVLCFFPLARSF